ncbi:hypothetical protein [Pedobacter alluvionis]|uniref:Uncharacterized protein n=1 Tax=Pedobacter alluvionis TaxID=475253 RepID=A0A497Y3Y1_9SPHI|nr:hypothetical protein [Pedobacter alluvionis]RLJ75167.1 hypothetical protein BCL90_3516 [Pedobacter alluvionis]TFB30267.1 hypothetical protein E3V97_19045 [Pedobacter alluvionis]
MNNDTDNKFTDWIYNRYVESIRNEDFTRMTLFFDVLSKYINTSLTQRRQSKQRRYADRLLKAIHKAHKSGTAKKLQLAGAEWQQEFEKAIAEYETMLTDMNLSKETIQEMVIEKRFNYGNH